MLVCPAGFPLGAIAAWGCEGASESWGNEEDNLGEVQPNVDSRFRVTSRAAPEEIKEIRTTLSNLVDRSRYSLVVARGLRPAIAGDGLIALTNEHD
jgi:hypothetical protein